MALHAILTAGGRLPPKLEKHSNSRIKALLNVGGRSLLAAAAGAARECGMLARTLAVGNDEVRREAEALGIEYAAEGTDVIENILNGYLALGGIEHDYLIISPDLPFVTGDALAHFIAAAASRCEIGFAVVTRDDFLKRFPGAPNFFEHIDGSRATMGSAIYLSGRALQTNIPLGRDFYRFRKYPVRLAALLGFEITVAFILRRLRIALAERRFSRLTGVEVRGFYVPDAEIAYDVDNERDLSFAEELLERERAAPPSV